MTTPLNQSGAYPQLFPIPSAPPWEIDPMPSAPPLFEADDECCICLEKLSDRPTPDAPRVLAQTDCHHFFHDFCLQQHLNSGVNQNCPLCRHPLSDRIAKIVLDDPRAPALAPAALPSTTTEAEPSQTTQLAQPSLLQGAAKIMGAVTIGLFTTAASIAWALTKGSFILLGKSAQALLARPEPATTPVPVYERVTEGLFEKLNRELITAVKDEQALLKRRAEELQETMALAASKWRRGDSADERRIHTLCRSAIRHIGSSRPFDSNIREIRALVRQMR